MPAPKTPNQTTGSSPPSEGSPTSRMKCACQSRSKPSLHIPANAAMPRIASSAGRARTRRAPCAPVWLIWANDPRSSRGSGANPVSGIARAKKSGEQDRAGSRDDDRQAQVDDREADARADPRQRGDAPDLGAAQVDAGEPLAADLVREPRVERAARERVPEAPERVRGKDRPHLGEGAEEDHGNAHHRGTDHDREAARVDVRDDSGRHLEDEDRDLHQRADEYELEGAHADLRDVVDRGDGEGQRRRGTRQRPRRRTRSRARTDDGITSAPVGRAFRAREPAQAGATGAEDANWASGAVPAVSDRDWHCARNATGRGRRRRRRFSFAERRRRSLQCCVWRGRRRLLRVATMPQCSLRALGLFLLVQ